MLQLRPTRTRCHSKLFRLVTTSGGDNNHHKQIQMFDEARSILLSLRFSEKDTTAESPSSCDPMSFLFGSRKIERELEAGYWPDLVGQTWYEAECKIRKQFPNITIQVLRVGSTVSKSFSPDRVQLFIDGEGKVVKAPSIG